MVKKTVITKNKVCFCIVRISYNNGDYQMVTYSMFVPFQMP